LPRSSNNHAARVSRRLRELRANLRQAGPGR